MTNTFEDIKDILSRIRRSEEYVKGWHTNISRWRKLYNMNHYSIKPKAGEVQYNDPTFVNTVDLSTGIMLGNELRWHAFGFGPSLEEQQNTGVLEKLLDGILTINAERAEKLITYNLFLNFNRDGGAVLYSVFDPTLARPVLVDVPDPESPAGLSTKYKFGDVPITTMVVDPLMVFLLPGGPKRWLMSGIKDTRTVLDVEIEYGIKLDRFSSLSEEVKSSTKDVFYNVWDFVGVMGEMKVRNTIIFGGQPVKGPEIMDGYTDLPITVNFFKPVGDDPSEWHNIMVPLESSVTLLERSFNRRAKQIDVFSSLPMVIKTQQGRKVSIDPGIFNSVNISPDEEISFPSWQGNAPDVQMHMDFLRSRVQQSGFSDVMFGSGNNQVAGYAISQLGDQNRIRLEQPIKHLELLLTVWAKKTIALLEYFAKDSLMCVYGKQKGKAYYEDVDISKISGYGIRAEIRPMYPNEMQRKVAMSTQVKGTLSEYTIMEKYLDIDQPEDEERRKLIEMTVKHPVAIQYAIIKELTERAAQGDDVAQKTLDSMQNIENVSGQEGRPQEPNAPEQLMGMQTPTGGTMPTRPAEPTAMAEQTSMANARPGMS